MHLVYNQPIAKLMGKNVIEPIVLTGRENGSSPTVDHPPNQRNNRIPIKIIDPRKQARHFRTNNEADPNTTYVNVYGDHFLAASTGSEKTTQIPSVPTRSRNGLKKLGAGNTASTVAKLGATGYEQLLPEPLVLRDSKESLTSAFNNAFYN